MKSCSFIIDDSKTLLNTLNSPRYLIAKNIRTNKLSNTGSNKMSYQENMHSIELIVKAVAILVVFTSSHNAQVR